MMKIRKNATCPQCLNGFPEDCWNEEPCKVVPTVPFSNPFASEEKPKRIVRKRATRKPAVRKPRISTPKPVREKRPVGRPEKAPGTHLDQNSAGRKWAAKMYPIKEGMICEWAGLKFAGGGVIPIVGCNGDNARHRHHGPDKNTLNNEYGNVHRICTHCHNLWHAKNDSFYPSERPSGDVPYLPEHVECRPHDRETKNAME